MIRQLAVAAALAARRTLLPLSLASLAAGCATSATATTPVVPASAFGREVTIQDLPGGVLKGWFQPGRRGDGALLILHGVGADHRDMVPRAGALAARGYAVLLLDFRGNGASTGGPTTYGLRESEDARAALEWLRARLPDERVGVIGVSMGGAAALLGAAPLRADAIVLESVYPTIDRAVEHRMRAWFGVVGRPLGPLLTRLVAGARGISTTALRPIERIGEVRVPVLVAAGSRDPYTPLDESRALFERAREPRSFWKVDGAAHDDLFLFDPSAYLTVVGGFLERTLRHTPAPAPGARSGEGPS